MRTKSILSGFIFATAHHSAAWKTADICLIHYATYIPIPYQL